MLGFLLRSIGGGGGPPTYAAVVSATAGATMFAPASADVTAVALASSGAFGFSLSVPTTPVVVVATSGAALAAVANADAIATIAATSGLVAFAPASPTAQVATVATAGAVAFAPSTPVATVVVVATAGLLGRPAPNETVTHIDTSFESAGDLALLDNFGDGNTDLTRSTTEARTGTWSVRIEALDTTWAVWLATVYPAVEYDLATLTMWLRGDATADGREILLGLEVYDSGFLPLGSVSAPVTISDSGWTMATATIQCPASSAYVFGGIQVVGGAATIGEMVYVDDMTLTTFRRNHWPEVDVAQLLTTGADAFGAMSGSDLAIVVVATAGATMFAATSEEGAASDHTHDHYGGRRQVRSHTRHPWED